MIIYPRRLDDSSFPAKKSNFLRIFEEAETDHPTVTNFAFVLKRG